MYIITHIQINLSYIKLPVLGATTKVHFNVVGNPIYIWINLLYFIKNLPKSFAFKIMLVLALINLGFIGFTIFTSNPFIRTFQCLLMGLALKLS